MSMMSASRFTLGIGLTVGGLMLSSGAFAAGLVRRFSRRAAHTDWEGADEAARGADQPILSGLRYILERGVELDEDDSSSAGSRRAAASSFSLCEALRH